MRQPARAKHSAAWLGPVLAAARQHATSPKNRTPAPVSAGSGQRRSRARKRSRSRAARAARSARCALDRRGSDRRHLLERTKKQRERPPEALVITPESVSVLLSYASSHDQLRQLDCVIVDEWHELLGTKRGVLLELSLAHLRALNPESARLGLVSDVAEPSGSIGRTRWAPGTPGASSVPPPRGGSRWTRSSRAMSVAFPGRDTWVPCSSRTSSPPSRAPARRCFFTNTRAQAEIWYRHIVETRLDWLTTVSLHHGSIDRKLRARIEQGLKSGELRCVVCTSSLDLGVDFPAVDQVIQVGSPKGIGRLMQRAGRSGHRPGETSRIVCVPTRAGSWSRSQPRAQRLASAASKREGRSVVPWTCWFSTS